jgi:glycosyltransferase involved in cell wall biosynthesis
MPKLSVIIPVYKVEKYLAECLDSVIAQTFTDWQAICVNDGSPDNSDKILAAYAARDSRFIIVNKENGGLSDARNVGLEHATGEYVMFLDSDDLLADENVLTQCVESMDTGCDLVAFNAQRFSENNHETSICLQGYIYPKSSMQIEVPDNKYCASFSNVCFCCFRKKIIDENALLFPKGLIFEDWPFMMMYSCRCKLINYIDKVFYRYRNNATSLTADMGERVFDIFTVYDLIQKELKNQGVWDKYIEITTLKLMFALPILYFNMLQSVTDPVILNNFLLKAGDLIKDIPDSLFNTNLKKSAYQYFFILLRRKDIKNNLTLCIKFKNIKHISQNLVLLFGILRLFGLKKLYHKIREKISNLVSKFV